ncbi:MAG: NADH-quinone oxidoreductase subunit C [Tepidisphaeraceae bacterium]
MSTRTIDHPALQPLKTAFPDTKFLVNEFRDQVTVIVPREAIKAVCKHLRDAQGYAMLFDLSAIDYQGYPTKMPGRFCVNYGLTNLKTNTRLWLKVFLDPTRTTAPGTGVRDEEAVEKCDPGLKLDSVYDIYPVADWMEREAWDLMGICFVGHPDLRRILTWNGFGSHPLRKDYPVRGIGEREDYKVISREGA